MLCSSNEILSSTSQSISVKRVSSEGLSACSRILLLKYSACCLAHVLHSATLTRCSRRFAGISMRAIGAVLPVGVNNWDLSASLLVLDPPQPRIAGGVRRTCLNLVLHRRREWAPNSWRHTLRASSFFIRFRRLRRRTKLWSDVARRYDATNPENKQTIVGFVVLYKATTLDRNSSPWTLDMCSVVSINMQMIPIVLTFRTARWSQEHDSFILFYFWKNK